MEMISVRIDTETRNKIEDEDTTERINKSAGKTNKMSKPVQ